MLNQSIKFPIVFSGGGARGYAHLGVIKALNEAGIFPSAISGTSSGAIMAAFLANGFVPDEIVEIFSGKLKMSMLGWNSFRSGVMSMNKIKEFLNANLRVKTFEELHFPVYITATNFITGEQAIFNTGNMIDVMIASSSIPVMFPPVVINEIPYVDGGLSNNLPVEPFASTIHNVIAVYVNPIKKYNSEESMLELMDRAVHVSFRDKVNSSAKGCRMLIEPQPLTAYGLFDIHNIEDLVKIGYDYTQAMLGEGL